MTAINNKNLIVIGDLVMSRWSKRGKSCRDFFKNGKNFFINYIELRTFDNIDIPIDRNFLVSELIGRMLRPTWMAPSSKEFILVKILRIL